MNCTVYMYVLIKLKIVWIAVLRFDKMATQPPQMVTSKLGFTLETRTCYKNSLYNQIKIGK